MAKKSRARKVAGKMAPSFEQALAQLEAIVRRLEDGQLTLDEALDQYEQGVGHLRTCNDSLARAERRIELLQRVDEQGLPVTEPFDATATDQREADDAPGSRGRPNTGRAPPPRPSSNMDAPDRLF